MPTTTFFNLPEDKRERVLDAALDELAEHGYRQASVSRIVARARIPKGSFYQYFADKRDLFLHVLQIAGDRKLAYVQEERERNPDSGFLGTLRLMVVSSMRLARDERRLSLLADSVLRDPTLRDEVIGAFAPQASLLLEGWIRQGIAEGELDPSIDVPLVARLIMSWAHAVGDQIRDHPEPLSDEDLAALYRTFISLLETGIKRRPDHDRGS